MSERRRRKIDVSFGDMPDIRTATRKDWRFIEDCYAEAVAQIQVPVDLDANDILRINGLVDSVYSQARFDYAIAKKMSKRYERRLANAKKTLKLTFKKEKGQTADDRDALITQYLLTIPLQGDKEPLLKLVEKWEEREIFMDAVLDNLTKISDRLINGNGALKLNSQGRGDTR